MGPHLRHKPFNPPARTDYRSMAHQWATLTDWASAVEAARSYWEHLNCPESCQDHYHCSPFDPVGTKSLSPTGLEAIDRLLRCMFLPYAAVSEHHQEPAEWDYCGTDMYLTWWEEAICRTSIGFLLPQTEMSPEVTGRFFAQLEACPDVFVIIKFPDDQTVEYNYSQSQHCWQTMQKRANFKDELAQEDFSWDGVSCDYTQSTNILSRFSTVGCKAVEQAQPIEVRVHSANVLPFTQLIGIVHAAWERSQ